MVQWITGSCRSRRLTRLGRAVSNSCRVYHSKVAAIPFAMTVQEAAQKTYPLVWGLYQSFPETSPIRAKAFYLPTWVSDAEMLIERTHFGSEIDGIAKHVQSVATLNGREMYYPGFARFPLSLITFPVAENMLSSQPWTPEMSSSVTCLPYTRTPFTIPAIAKSMSSTQAHYSDQLHFDPKSITFPVIGPVYPILFPVILLSYRVPLLSLRPRRPSDETKTATVILEAHSRDGRTYVDDLGILGEGWEKSSLPDTGVFVLKLLLRALRFQNRTIKWTFGYQTELPLAFPKEGTPFPTLGVFGNPLEARLKLHGSLGRIPDKQDSLGSKGRLPPLEKLISAWAERTMLASELALSNRPALSEKIDWDDPRIRPPTRAEIVANSEYTTNRIDWQLCKSLASKDKTWMSDPSLAHPNLSDVNIELEKAEVRMKSSVPPWLQEWDLRRKRR